MKTNIHQFREEMKQKFETWRETGHDITYEQWLEICLSVEIENRLFLIREYRAELARLGRMLAEMTSLTDWQAAGYTIDQYDAHMARYGDDHIADAGGMVEGGGA